MYYHKNVHYDIRKLCISLKFGVPIGRKLDLKE